MLKNRVLRRIFGPMREEVTGGWRRLHNEELHNLSSTDIITVTHKGVGHAENMGEMINAYILAGKPEGKITLGRPRRRWENNTSMHLRGIVWKVVDWIHLAQDRDQWRAVVKAVMNLRIS
jgi:hypothetical protein